MSSIFLIFIAGLAAPSWPSHRETCCRIPPGRKAERSERNKTKCRCHQMSSDVYWLHLITFDYNPFHIFDIFHKAWITSCNYFCLFQPYLCQQYDYGFPCWNCIGPRRGPGTGLYVVDRRWIPMFQRFQKRWKIHENPLSDMFTRPTGISLEVSWKYPGEQRVPFNSTSKRLKRSYSAATCAATLSNRTFRCWNQFCYEQDQ